MDEHTIFLTLADLIRDVLEDPDFDVTPKTSAEDHPEWDSFNHINMIVAAEIHFGVKFNAGDIENVQTVGEFAALVAKKRKAA